MQDPANLRVARAAEELAVLVYKVTATYPRDERFGLTAQMRRAAVSVGSNICEGCARQGDKALVAFLYIAHGSCAELDFQLRVAHRLGLGDPIVSKQLATSITTLNRSLSALIGSLRKSQS